MRRFAAPPRGVVVVAVIASTGLGLGLGCKGKAQPAQVPVPAAVGYDRKLVERDDCVHHAAALVALDDAVLVVGACGRVGEGDRGEEIVAVRVDGQGVPAPAEPVHVLEQGWATSVVAARVRGGGALVGYTIAENRRAQASVVPVDVQGRPSGAPVELGAGRAVALVGGPQGAALALVAEADELSDADPAATAKLVVVVLDADGHAVARAAISERVDGARAGAALAGNANGYGVVWSEAGRLWGSPIDASGRGGAREPLAPPFPRLAWPALAIDERGRTIVVALIEGDGHGADAGKDGEIWLGEGILGEPEARWRWRRVVAKSAARRARLAVALAPSGDIHLAWQEERQGREYPALVSARLLRGGGEASAPTVILSDTVLFDGAVALVVWMQAVVFAAAQPPAGDREQTSLGVAQRVD